MTHIDTNRAALFSKNDEAQVRRLLQEAHFDDFGRLLERCLNDQTAYDQLHNRALDPLQALKKLDLVTTSGMQRLAKLATGKTTTSFTHGACGTGTAAESLADNVLGAEVRRVALVDRFDSGTAMKFAVLFDSTTASGTYTEFGIFDAAASGNMLSRSVFNPGGIVHTQNSTLFTFTEVVNQSSS